MHLISAFIVGKSFTKEIQHLFFLEFKEHRPFYKMQALLPPPAAAIEAVPASALFALWGWLLAQPHRGSSAASSKHITSQATAQKRAFSFSEISPTPPRARRLGAAPALQPADFIWARCWCQGKRGDVEEPAHPAQPSGLWAAP